MKKDFFGMSFPILFAGMLTLTLMSGCRSNDGSTGGLYGSDIFHDGRPVADVPLNDLAGLPTDGDRSIFAAVFFSYDSAAVNPIEAVKCEKVAAYLKRRGGGVILEGHGDERGSREYNLVLGERRALAVRDYLMSLGVAPDSIQTKSFGEEMPLDSGHNETAWSRNRRVVFAIY